MHAREGQNRHFASHFFTSTVERTGQAVRGGVQIAGGYKALWSSTVSWLGYEERARVDPISHPLPHPLLSLSPTPIETLAAAMALHLRFDQVSARGRRWIGHAGRRRAYAVGRRCLLRGRRDT
jgi:hypothetical protein